MFPHARYSQRLNNMNSLKFFPFFIFMVVGNKFSAQEKTGPSLQWKLAAKLPALNGQPESLGYAGPVAGVHNNRLIIAGGANFPGNLPWFGGKKKYYDHICLFEKKRSRLIAQTKIFTLPSPIAYAASCSTPMGLFYAGGENETGISKQAWLLQWDEINKTIITRELPPLPLAITNASATIRDFTVFIAGGESRENVSSRFFSFDLQNVAAGWKELSALPKPVSHGVLSVLNNNGQACIYLAGGRKKNPAGPSELYSTLYEYDLGNNKWKEKKSLPYPLSAGTGIGSGQNILLFGGDKGETFSKTEELIAGMERETDSLKKESLNQQKIALQSSHPGFSKEVLLYNIRSNEWKVIDTIPFNTPVTTTALKWGRHIIIPSGEIRAGVRTPYIISVKLPANYR